MDKVKFITTLERISRMLDAEVFVMKRDIELLKKEVEYVHALSKIEPTPHWCKHCEEAGHPSEGCLVESEIFNREFAVNDATSKLQ